MGNARQVAHEVSSVEDIITQLQEHAANVRKEGKERYDAAKKLAQAELDVANTTAEWVDGVANDLIDNQRTSQAELQQLLLDQQKGRNILSGLLGKGKK